MKDAIKVFFEHMGRGYSVYEESLRIKDETAYFMVKGDGKKLVVASKSGLKHGFSVEKEFRSGGYTFWLCEVSNENAEVLRKIFDNLNPVLCGKRPSFGTGDRLGIATPGHVKAFEGSKLFPFFAQQSVRENERTGRTWRDVLSDAIWGMFQVGYDGPFGADADHIKREEDLIKAIEEGYTMFTVDPSDHVRSLSKLSEAEKNAVYSEISKKHNYSDYIGREYRFDGVVLKFDEKTLRDAVVVYSDAIDHVEKLYRILKDRKHEFDFEVSVDETETPTSPLFHVFIAQELIKRDVDFQNLALRFVGDWQKAIDYIGDLQEFERELRIHAAIAKEFGGYKLSLHSGSDKFSVYRAFARETNGLFHVKTAGTSYLEAIKVIALKLPDLYRKIHKYALEVFEKDRTSYHVTTDLSKIPDVDSLSAEELPKLFENNDSRQLIHITYGSVLRKFKDDIFNALMEYEKVYHDLLKEHIGKHIKLLGI